MKKNIFAFGFRYEGQLGKQLRSSCRNEAVSLNALVVRALIHVGELHDKGRVNFSESSRFLLRADKGDRKTTLLTMRAETREMVRNLAFSYRISMAEVIRLALEVYLDFLNYNDGKIDIINHIYRTPQDLVHAVVIVLFPALPGDSPPYPLLL